MGTMTLEEAQAWEKLPNRKPDDAINRMTEIFAEEDPMGLISMGTPRDEYSPECHAIYWSSYRTPDDWHEVAIEIFTYYFNGLNFNRDAVVRAMIRILEEKLV